MKKINQKGITLIALIITIIVLLILSAVVLNMVIGQNGIFGKANWASFVTEYSQVQEASDLYAMEVKTEEYGKNTTTTINNEDLYAKIDSKITPEGTLKKTIEGIENINDAEIYKLDKEKLNLDTKNDYVVNITTGKVYRYKGFKYNGNTYHTPQYSIVGNGDEPTPEIDNYQLDESYHFVTTTDAKARISFEVKLSGKLEGASVTVKNPTSNNANIEGTYDNSSKKYTGTISSKGSINPNGTYSYEVIATKDEKEYKTTKMVTIEKFLDEPKISAENLKWNSFDIKVTPSYPEDSVNIKYFINDEEKESKNITGLTSSTTYTAKIEASIKGNESEKVTKDAQVTTLEKVTEINYIEDLETINNDLTDTYILTRNLDFKDKNSYKTTEKFNYYTVDNDGDGNPDNSWKSLGSSADNFTGTFNGDFHSISNLYINNSSNDSVGLFAYAGKSAKIMNLKLEDVNINSTKATVGTIIGTIKENVEVSKIGVSGKINVTGNSIVGGVAGAGNSSKISQCYSECIINASDSLVGGILGTGTSMNDEPNNCFFAGTIDAGNEYNGGIRGGNWTYVTKCLVIPKEIKVKAGWAYPFGHSPRVYYNYWSSQYTTLTSIGTNDYVNDVTYENLFKKETYTNLDIAEVNEGNTDSIWVIEEGNTTPYLRWAGKRNSVLKTTLDSNLNK